MYKFPNDYTINSRVNYDSITFILDILEQEGRIFNGIRRSSGYSEDIVGYIDVDGYTLYFTDHDGYMKGEILTVGTIKDGFLETDENVKIASWEYSAMIRLRL